MTHEQIMEWAERWHYPFLRIGDEADSPISDVLRHGREHYEDLRNHPERLALASLRIQHWNYITGSDQENAAA